MTGRWSKPASPYSRRYEKLTSRTLNSEEAAVKFLLIEASAANLITYQQKVEWLERELSVRCHNQLILMSFIKCAYCPMR